MIREVRCLVVSTVVGLAVWLPTSSTVPQGDEGSSSRGYVLWAGLITAAAVLGWTYPGLARIVATGLVGGPLMTAFWTAPRGDNDGLWTLIFPYLIFIGLVLLLPAWIAGRCRDRLARGS